MYLDLIYFEPCTPGGTTFVPFYPCPLNPGVLDESGRQALIENYIYVDDCLLAATRLHM